MKSRGTFRKDRHSDDVDSQLAPNCPKPPEHLAKEARKKWLEVGALLAKRGLATELDSMALELMIGSYMGMRDATAQLADEDLIIEVGGGEHSAPTPIANPLIGVVSKNIATLKWALKEFGCTPAARTGIKLAAGEKPKDPMAELLAARARRK